MTPAIQAASRAEREAAKNQRATGRREFDRRTAFGTGHLDQAFSGNRGGASGRACRRGRGRKPAKLRRMRNCGSASSFGAGRVSRDTFWLPRAVVWWTEPRPSCAPPQVVREFRTNCGTFPSLLKPAPLRRHREPLASISIPFIRSVFATSIAPRLAIAMPRVMSGTFSSATISTSLTAAAKLKAPDNAAAAVATAAALTVSSATPKRISARLELALEDIAAIGAENFENILRENMALILSDALDAQLIS